MLMCACVCVFVCGVCAHDNRYLAGGGVIELCTTRWA